MRSIFVIILFTFIFTPAQARVIIKEQTKYYNVSGRTGEQVYAKFGRRGPWKIRRQHAIAATEREFDFKNIVFGQRGGKCVLTSVDVYLTVTYYYPRWTDKKRASKNLQNLWSRFLKELVRHENVHGRYFKETMRQFEHELLKVTGKLSDKCSGMAQKARQRLDRAYQKGEKKHEAFDRRELRANSPVRKLERAFSIAK